MAEYYVEPKTYPAYAATPANSTTAYDGDGLAKGLATPATVSIDLTAYTAAATNTFAIGGATLTCVASAATTNQFNAGSGATLAANLASSINAATATLAASSPAAGWMAHQLRNVVYASASGATLNIQTRAGSAVYNANSSFRCVSVGFTGGSQRADQFANGVSGAWGFLFNDSADGTMWPIAAANKNYGFVHGGVVNTGLAPIAGPSAGIVMLTDVVNIRCNNTTLYPDADNYGNITTVSFGRSAFYLFDDGTVWPEDTGYLTVAFRQGSIYTGSLEFGQVVLSNRNRNWTRGLKIKTMPSRGSGLNILPPGSAEVVMDGILFEDVGCSIYMGMVSRQIFEFTFRDCYWSVRRNTWYTPFSPYITNYERQKLTIEGCVFDFSLWTGGNGVLANVSGGGSQGGHSLVFRNNKLLATSTGHMAITGTPAFPVIVENCTNMAINVNLGFVGSTAAPTNMDYNGHVLQQGMTSPEQFRYENRWCIVEWDPNGNFPSYNSVLPDGTPWSILWQWSNSANANRLHGSEILRRSTFVTQANMQTVTLELNFDPAITPKDSDMGLIVAYTKASDSKVYYETTHLGNATKWLGTGTIQTSAASWTQSGVYAAWVARKLVKTLSGVIKQNTTIDVALIQYKPNAGAGTSKVFVNPEIGLSA